MEDKGTSNVKEKLLVLAKASPIISNKYNHLVCVAGINQKQQWRRIYPVPWEFFIGGGFKKKSWIEYEMLKDEPSDFRQESRKVKDISIKQLHEEKFSEIKKQLDNKITTLENLYQISRKQISLGVIKPYKILDFITKDNEHYIDLVEKQKQKTLAGKSVIQIFIPKKSFSYKFLCSKDCPKSHEITCEDWELMELYRNCENYRKEGKYKDESEVLEKVKQKFLIDLPNKKELYFIMGTHFMHPTYLIISVVYPRNTDVF